MALSPEAERRALELLDAALEWDETKRADFIKHQTAYADEEKQRALALLSLDDEPATIQTAGGLMEAAGPGEEPPPEILQSWRVTGVIGRGGMGSVYRGERHVGDFDQTVAIKIVRRPAEGLISGLQNERRLLARLSHPNICQLFDGGETPDGRPYFIMEFVDGVPLEQLLTTENLGTERCLGLFAQLLEGLEYAHRFGIAHQDLSTGNVLINDRSGLKIIDFGLGGFLGEEVHGKTLPGTAGFAPPERGTDREDPILGDVFSAGRILARLLANTDFKRRVDLQAIADKASSPDPSARYQSVRELFDDFERYRSARSVHARGRGPLYAFQRFAARHPRSVGGTVTALLTLSAALASISVLYVRAERAEAEAVARYDSVRSLARTVLFDVYGELERIPRTNEARRLVTDIGQQYLNELETDPRAGPELSFEIASGFLQLGQILGNANEEPFDDPERSEAAWQNAEQRLRALLDENPKDSRVLSNLGTMEVWKGNLAFLSRENWPAAVEHFQTAADYLSRAIEEGDVEIGTRVDLIGAHKLLSDLHAQSARPEEAEAAMAKARALSAELETTHPEEPDTWIAAANIRRTLAQQQQQGGDIAASIQTSSEALVYLERAAELREDDLSIFRDRAMTYARRGFAHLLADDNEAAVPDYDRAVALTERRLAIEPDNADARFQYVVWSAEQAIPLGRLGEIERAEEALQPAEEYYLERFRQNPEEPRRQRTMLVHYLQLAEVYRGADRDEDRCRATAEGLRYADMMSASGTLSASDAAGVQTYRDQLEECDG